MKKVSKYKELKRKDCPDWIGWFILDFLKQQPDQTEEHKREIKVQLKYEYKLHTQQHGTHQTK